MLHARDKNINIDFCLFQDFHAIIAARVLDQEGASLLAQVIL